MTTAGSNEKLLIIMRGFPGAGKSTLTSAIANYFDSKSKESIVCSHDKYHWSTNDFGQRVFKFNYSIHRKTKQWFKDEVQESIENSMPIIILDNGNFEKREYQQFQSMAHNNNYRSIVLEIKSETQSMTRVMHLNHIQCRNKYNNIAEKHFFDNDCYLCEMQFNRCKMKIPNKVMQICIDKYENDRHAVMIEPKFDRSQQWTNRELQHMLSLPTNAIHVSNSMPTTEEKRRQNEDNVNTDGIVVSINNVPQSQLSHTANSNPRTNVAFVDNRKKRRKRKFLDITANIRIDSASTDDNNNSNSPDPDTQASQLPKKQKVLHIGDIANTNTNTDTDTDTEYTDAGAVESLNNSNSNGTSILDMTLDELAEQNIQQRNGDCNRYEHDNNNNNNNNNNTNYSRYGYGFHRNQRNGTGDGNNANTRWRRRKRNNNQKNSYRGQRRRNQRAYG